MTVNGEVATHPTSVVKLSPLKKSASFTISVDKVEVCVIYQIRLHKTIEQSIILLSQSGIKPLVGTFRR